MIHPEDVMGLSEEAARKIITDDALRCRVVYRDGTYMVCTQDVRFDRMNIAIEGGVVVRAYIG